MIAAGIDGGSRAIKAALLETETGRIVGSGLCDQGVECARLAAELLDRVLAEAGLGRRDLGATVATGYTRNVIEADRTVTEITCHARGVRHLVPEARSIVEIGGQDSKVIKLGPTGGVEDFAMNDRCAAGTGRFLEMVAGKLEVGLEALGALAAAAEEPAAISSMCVVFAETEIIGLLAARRPREEIVAGVQKSLAARVAAQAGRLLEPIFFTGGVARVPGMREALAQALGRPVALCPRPALTGAIGAAVLAGKG